MASKKGPQPQPKKTSKVQKPPTDSGPKARKTPTKKAGRRGK